MLDFCQALDGGGKLVCRLQLWKGESTVYIVIKPWHGGLNIPAQLNAYNPSTAEHPVAIGIPCIAESLVTS